MNGTRTTRELNQVVLLPGIAQAHGLLTKSVARDDDSSPRVAASTPREPIAGDVAAQEQPAAPDEPKNIGRYRVEKLLGQGGFGAVYLAHDDDLHRKVAIKVPRPDRVATPEQADAFRAEARVVASLDHPHIVPVFDVGRTPQGLCFVVSKFIEGSDLEKRVEDARAGERPLSHAEAADIIANMADALRHAHANGLIHRDVKPQNILLDTAGKPYLTDFGLAWNEADGSIGPGLAGTPAFMSPEQANGEGHRIDGRSDLFSLGVVFYYLLTRQRPFDGLDIHTLLDQICHQEVEPPELLDRNIPAELSRICLKMLAKRIADRYSSAAELVNDLRRWQEPVRERQSGRQRALSASRFPIFNVGQTHREVVPKGLRSFDADDADFFLDLLPGPRDREGLPESLRFWKTRLEETDPDNTFAVGLVYGPSGCGKSSLMKAGLLPRLSANCVAVYVEATPDQTEARLLKGLRKQCPELAANQGLKEALAELRRTHSAATSGAGRKTVIVLDQFEQWLHAKREENNTELVTALRQCDGHGVQCLVLVRDDFWMAATRFMRDLEIRLVEGQNSAAVDLFDVDHAKKVLAAFGAAYGKLPKDGSRPDRDQQEFVNRAVAGLSQEGKVICVRLALFAEMMKGKPWTTASLKAVGGADGVGVTFLEETFCASTAPPEHRCHQQAARVVLKALLPDTGTDIKGHMRSQAELLQASGYTSRPRDFADLLDILDREVRLITPTDPIVVSGQWPAVNADGHLLSLATDHSPLTTSRGRCYQLTHDYLVPSIRDWLTRKQKETRRGRAELRLAERAAAWNAKPEIRQLPTLAQSVGIRLLTKKKQWTAAERIMMRRATRYHLLGGAVTALLLAGAAIAGLDIHSQVVEQRRATYAAGLVQALLNANTAEAPAIIAEMAEYRQWTESLLVEEFQSPAANGQHKLNASMALLLVDRGQVDYLYGRLLDAEPAQVPVIRDALAPYQEELLGKLWSVVESPAKGQERQRLRAAAALARYDADSQRWTQVQTAIASDLVRVPAGYMAAWLDSLRPVRAKLLDPLAMIFRNGGREAERSLAADILADYAADQPRLLADLLMDADEQQFGVLYSVAVGETSGSRHRGPDELPVRSAVLSALSKELDRKPPANTDLKARESLAKRQANAAVALLKMGQSAKVWPLLEHRSDPTARSYLIHRLCPLGADPAIILKHLDEELDVTIFAALILSLGEYGEAELSTEARAALLPKLQRMYQADAPGGLHGALEWLLRTWKQEEWLKQMNEEWRATEAMREKTRRGLPWHITCEGQTMVVIPGPIEYLMGSRPEEPGRLPHEKQHPIRIGRTFAIADRPVTVAQFRRFHRAKFGADPEYVQKRAPTEDCPIHYTTWYMAAAYCNWLSEQEGISEDQWCYETDAQGRVSQLKQNCLELTGYRMPTEAEWEYACRAGTSTRWHHGDAQELLGKYSWYLQNADDRTWPVASKKPNDFGLFDMHGNVWSWCQETYAAYPDTLTEDRSESDLKIDVQKDRVLRGGALDTQASTVRSASRYWYAPAVRSFSVGFRVARTIP